MLKKIFGAVVAALLAVSMLPVTGLAVERYEVLQIGDEDAWVTELQEKLCELGYLQPPATGYYGTNTQSAVVAYQRDHGLTADGKAGPITRQSILGDQYTPITGPRDEIPGPSAKPDENVPAPGDSQDGSEAPETPQPSTVPSDPAASPEPIPSAEPTAPSTGGEPSSSPEPSESAEPGASSEPSDPAVSPEPSESAAPPETDGDPDALKLGDRGDAVSDLQRRLKELEYYDYSQITGYFGPVTEESVKKFERTSNFELDGVVTPEELEFLNSESVKYYTMFPGDQGDDIYAMQNRLIELGYMDPEATGYYGTATTLAVRLFQETNGLLADGTAGKDTRALLYSDKAIKNGEGQPVDSDDLPGTDAAPSSGVAKLISVAESQTGKRYVYGASGPNAYDCSGLVYYALKGAGVSVSRMSSAGYASVSSWKTVKNKSDLQIGDLVFFKSDSSSSISHVGIYIGGGNIIHAAPSIGGVGVSSMSSGYYSRNFVSAKRVF